MAALGGAVFVYCASIQRSWMAHVIQTRARSWISARDRKTVVEKSVEGFSAGLVCEHQTGACVFIADKSATSSFPEHVADMSAVAAASDSKARIVATVPCPTPEGVQIKSSRL
eukprot:2361863-Rhodomonas_salina.1